MFRWIIGSSIKFRFVIVALAVAMVIYGMDRLRYMPIDVFPEFSPPLVEIQTEGPGMSTEEIEELITIPMEEALRGTPGLDVLRSQSVVGLSAVRLLFKQGFDILRARQLVQERLQLAIPNLPASAGRPIMLQPLSATSRTMKIGISSKTINTRDLSVITYWNMRPQLLSVPGVANVAIWGFKKRQLQVLFDPVKMVQHGVTVDKLLEVTAEALDLVPATVKTRLLRARRRLQKDLAPEVRATLSGTFPFAGVDCEGLTRRVVENVCGKK